ncbi:uncharacterized protein LOC141702950 isoform X3 [Apium graveolens]|uniref:uncharacterized protein LOC141702950 isoform X3 n=1 Tax=Apium graveolens TaxID=4045 RepID=UPI003D7BB6DF
MYSLFAISPLFIFICAKFQVLVAKVLHHVKIMVNLMPMRQVLVAVTLPRIKIMANLMPKKQVLVAVALLRMEIIVNLMPRRQVPPASARTMHGGRRIFVSLWFTFRPFTSSLVLDVGKQDQSCGFCGAQVWAAEFIGRYPGTGAKGYSICCGKGKVQLPLLRRPPHYYLLHPLCQSHFWARPRFITTCLLFIHTGGGGVDHSVNKGKGPYVFRVSEETYHAYGSLVAPDG